MTACTLGTFAEQWEVELPEHLIFNRRYVCPNCCQPWALLSNGQSWVYSSYPAPCENCEPPTFYPWQCVPGSLLLFSPDGEPDPIIPFLPADLLAREFDLHTKANHERSDTTDTEPFGTLPPPGSEWPPRGTDGHRQDV